MSNQLYRDTYQGYKSGTAKIARWLSETAQSIVPTASKKQGSQKTNTKGQEIVLTAGDFVRLAKSITSNSSASVPEAILYTLKSVIQARKLCAAWCAAEAKDDGGGHAQFVKLLQEVYDLLKPRVVVAQTSARSSRPERTPAAAKVSDAAYLNLFEHLHLDEPTADPDTPLAPRSPNPSSQKPDKETLKYRLEDNTATELSLAAFYYFWDWADIRQFVHKTWTAYKRREITLINASLTTNIAVDLLRRAETDIVELFQGRMAETEIHEIILSVFLRSSPSSGTGQCGYSEAEILELQGHVAASYRALSAFSHVVSTKQLREMTWKKAVQKQLNILRAEESELLVDSAIEESYFVLMEDLVMIASVYRNGMIPKVEDEIMYGVYTFLAGGAITSWIVNAWTVFRDIRDCLADNSLAQPFSDLEQTANRWLAVHKEQVQYFRSQSDDIKAEHASLHSNVLGHLTAFLPSLQAWVLEGHGCRCRNHGARPCASGRDFIFRHPLSCGVFALSLSMNLYNAGYSWNTGSRLTDSLAHLYNAARQPFNGEIPVWDDMEAYIAHVGSRNLFYGDLPSTPVDIYKRACIYHGVKMTDLASDNHQHYRSLHSVLHKARHLKDPESMKLWKILVSRWRDHWQDDRRGLVNLHAIERNLTRCRKGSSEVRSRPSEFLADFSSTIADMEPRLYFDYFALGRRTQDLVYAIRERSIALDLRAAAHCACNNSRYVLQILCPREYLKIGTRDDSAPKIKEAGRMIQEVVGDRGDEEVKKALVLCTQN